MHKSKLFLSMFLGISILLLPSSSRSAAAASAAGAARVAERYKDKPLPEVVQADVNTRKAGINKALGAGGFDISNNIRRNTKLAAEGRDRDHILAIHEESRSAEENREYRFSMGSGAFIAADGKLFYVKGKQPKYGRTIYPFAVLSKRNVGLPYPEERIIAYSTPIDGVDVLNVEQFPIKELCKKSKWQKDDRGRIIKDDGGRNVIAEVDFTEAMHCVDMIDDLLINMDGAFNDLANHGRIKEIFVGFHTIENQCARVFAKEDCDSLKSGNPIYQRISLLKENYRSLIWAYNYLLHETESLTVGPLEGDAAVEEE